MLLLKDSLYNKTGIEKSKIPTLICLYSFSCFFLPLLYFQFLLSYRHIFIQYFLLPPLRFLSIHVPSICSFLSFHPFILFSRFPPLFFLLDKQASCEAASRLHTLFPPPFLSPWEVHGFLDWRGSATRILRRLPLLISKACLWALCYDEFQQETTQFYHFLQFFSQAHPCLWKICGKGTHD